jgi:tellurium resistance protein TerD
MTQSHSLASGESLALPSDLLDIKVGIGWETAARHGAGLKLVGCAEIVRTTGGSLRDSIFWMQKKLDDGSVVHVDDNQNAAADADKSVFTIDLNRLAGDIERIVFALVIVSKVPFAQTVDAAFIRIVDQADGNAIAHFTIANPAAPESTLILGQLYRQDGGLHFAAIGEGCDGTRETIRLASKL